MIDRFGNEVTAGAGRANGGVAPSPRPEELIRAREAAGDRIAAGLGLVLAACSLSLLIYGIQTSASQAEAPTLLPSMADGLPVNRSLAASRQREVDLDAVSTGSLARVRKPAPSVPSELKSPSRDYVVWRVFGGVALIEGPDGLREVVPGAVLPGAGQVLSFERSDRGWVVVTSQAIIGAPTL